MFILIFICIIGLIIIYGIILQSIRNKAARNVLGSLNLQKEREKILAINQNFGFAGIEKTQGKCPFCDNYLILKQGTYDQFWECNNPVCKYTRNKTTQKHNRCPFCNGRLVLKRGPYSQFWGCGNYPKCKYKRKVKRYGIL